ncbi:MAG: ABC transporter ATP-binding protein [Lentisphaerae bacterium]|nr:ABC transporter ATP-binding protein [Lentisphaerota bacterium]
MPKDVVLSVRNVSKKFCRNLRRSMAYGIKDLSCNLLGIRQDTSRLRREEFWALRDVSFDLRRGEVLGLIGPNGCGKSTLLRLIHGIFPPDAGSITTRGRVGALIALGAGFHPHMTGRENVRLNGSILGISASEIEARMDEIIDFAEIHDFIDAPVSTYSSGMRVRLGFSIAVQMEPELLLVDEVLAVGDVGFRTKGINRIVEIMDRSAVIFVSHAMNQVSRVATQLLHLSGGRIEYLGTDVGQGIAGYLESFAAPGSTVVGSGKAELLGVSLTSTPADDKQSESGCTRVGYGATVRLCVRMSVHPTVESFSLVVTVADNGGGHVCALYSRADAFFVENTGRPVECVVDFCNYLSPGRYALNVALVDQTEDRLRPGEVFANCLNVTSLHSVGDRVVSHVGVQMRGEWRINEG